jgi:SAM-dependent MidA family methyltransferase
MPVHRVEQTERGLMEITVVVEGGGLGWGRRPARPRLADYFASHGLTLAVGQMAEINLQAEPHHRRLLDRLPAGVVLVLDYGYPAERLYDGRGRRFGSLATYRRHELGVDPLDAPGERDLTAHVNFDDLRRAGTSCGWCDLGLMPLAEFLVRAGLGRRLDERGFGIDAALDADTVAARQEVKRLLDPEGMGSDLKMLVQGRGKIGEIAAEILGRDP